MSSAIASRCRSLHARKTFHEFNDTITKTHAEECLWAPDAEDLRNAFQFHELKHGKKGGMLGSLDCSHSPWKNCPVAWQQSFQGAKKTPTVVLEAICDQHLCCGHIHAIRCSQRRRINSSRCDPLRHSSSERRLQHLGFFLSSVAFSWLPILTRKLGSAHDAFYFPVAFKSNRNVVRSTRNTLDG